jgi:ABC-type spermidine/putrescine transport system permease subunit II
VGDPTTANGRTILSAGLTLALLILPIIIINSREAIKAVPGSLRDSSYGLGATKWQTIWHHVLPASFDRILTGTILAVSRAIGETAPLVVVGASTFITVDPTSIFFQVHHIADPDLPVVGTPSGGVSKYRCRGDRRPARTDAVDERRRDRSAEPHIPKEEEPDR